MTFFDEGHGLGLYTVLAMTIATVLLVLTWQRNRSQNLPPGPLALPLIGHLHLFLWGGVQGTLRKLAKTYGDMFTVQLGPKKIVFLNSRDVIREALALSEFSGRPNLSYAVNMSNSGLIFSTGDLWKSNRKLCLRSLSELGFAGKRNSEATVVNEMEILMATISENDGKAFDIRPSLANAVSNVMCRMIFGKRYHYHDKEFLDLMESLEIRAKTPFLMLMIPCPEKIPFLRRKVQSVRAATEQSNRTILQHIERHRSENWNQENQESDLIDAYVNRKSDDPLKVLDTAIFDDDHVIRTILDIFSAGTETTTTTLLWMLVYIINFPDVQEKLRAEVHSVVGTGRMPSFSDKSAMPFTNAFMAEVQRLACLLPQTVPHTTTDDIVFRGFTIPANTFVVASLLEVHMSEQDFPNPEVFRPERFIDGQGRFNTSLAEKTMPFGTGRRVCLGESLARMEIFLIVTSLVQRFVFTTPDGVRKPSLVGVVTLVNSPPFFELCATPIFTT